MIKAALINILMVTVAKMTVFTAKGVASSDKLTEDYHSTLQLPVAFQCLSAFITAAVGRNSEHLNRLYDTCPAPTSTN